MPRLPVKSKLGDSDSAETRNNNQPYCPTPRRLKNNLPEFIAPLRCTKHSQQSFDARSGILNFISDKEIDGRESKCNGCIASCYSGSPPDRAHNPLVNDVLFNHLQESNFLISLPNPTSFTN